MKHAHLDGLEVGRQRRRNPGPRRIGLVARKRLLYRSHTGSQHAARLEETYCRHRAEPEPAARDHLGDHPHRVRFRRRRPRQLAGHAGLDAGPLAPPS
jgi:hypothetical protein